jgi:hypothetical protein
MVLKYSTSAWPAPWKKEEIEYPQDFLSLKGTIPNYPNDKMKYVFKFQVEWNRKYIVKL